MKIKVLALALSMLFVTSIAGTTFAQMTDNTVKTVVVDDDKDKNKKTSKKNSKDAKQSDCKEKTSCCKSSKLNDKCKDDKKSTDKDKR